jgi:hypothetical protein
MLVDWLIITAFPESVKYAGHVKSASLQKEGQALSL